jgi:2-polyprenyl-3-methyl-5-hydroxy-6-metoxy-1,4-benzoquinol methylase
MRFFRRLVKFLIGKIHLNQGRQPVLDEATSVANYGDAWLSSEIPEQQWDIAQGQLERLKGGDLTPEFSGFVRAISSGLNGTPEMFKTLLEIGCASGYYGKVLNFSFPGIQYYGVDFSTELIKFGKQKFPELSLDVGDTTKLNFEDQQFDIVVSGGVLLHVYEWKLGVMESCRTASKLVILHRTPVSQQRTALFVKTAYGVKMIEWTFNEEELLNEVQKHDFRLIESFPVYPGDVLSDDASVPTQFTYVFTRNL